MRAVPTRIPAFPKIFRRAVPAPPCQSINVNVCNINMQECFGAPHVVRGVCPGKERFHARICALE